MPVSVFTVHGVLPTDLVRHSSVSVLRLRPPEIREESGVYCDGHRHSLYYYILRFRALYVRRVFGFRYRQFTFQKSFAHQNRIL